MKRRGMEWHEFRGLIDRNRAPNADIRYYRDPKKFPDKITILDRNLPRRREDPESLLGWSPEDHFLKSQVCESSFFRGEIPMEGSEGVYRDGKFVQQPYRGALATLQIMLNEGCLRHTDEIRRLFADQGRRLRIRN